MPDAPPLKKGLTPAQMGFRGAFFSDMVVVVVALLGAEGRGGGGAWVPCGGVGAAQPLRAGGGFVTLPNSSAIRRAAASPWGRLGPHSTLERAGAAGLARGARWHRAAPSPPPHGAGITPPAQPGLCIAPHHPQPRASPRADRRDAWLTERGYPLLVGVGRGRGA